MPTQADIATHLDLSQQRISEILADLGLEVDAPLDRIRVAYIRRLRETAGAWGSTGEREALLRVRRQRQELALARDRGELVPVQQFREVAFRRYRGVRDKLLNIPDRVASVLAQEHDPVRVHHTLTEELKRVLLDLSDEARDEVARARRAEAPDGGGT